MRTHQLAAVAGKPVRAVGAKLTVVLDCFGIIVDRDTRRLTM